MPSIGISLVTYENQADISQTLSALSHSVWPGEVKIVLIDNNSQDSTVSLAAKIASQNNLPIIILPQKTNLGFTGGNNEAYRQLKSAFGIEPDFFVALNPDTQVHPDWLKELLPPLEAKSIGATTSRLMLPDGTVNALGCGLHFAGFGFTLNYRSRQTQFSNQLVNYPSGAAFALKREALHAIQDLVGDQTRQAVFYPELFLYHEDLDLGWRLNLAGYATELVASSVVTHFHKFAATPRNSKKFFYQERNRYLVLLQNYHWGTLILLAPWLLLGEICLAFLSLLPGQRISRRSVWVGIWHQIKSCHFWQRRHLIQSHRQVSDRVIWSELQATIAHQDTETIWIRYLINPAMRMVHAIYGLIIWW